MYDVWNADIGRYMKVAGIPGVITVKNDALKTPLVADPGERWEYGINIDWAGKAERKELRVPVLPLFVHERLSTQAVIQALQAHRRALRQDPSRSALGRMKTVLGSDLRLTPARCSLRRASRSAPLRATSQERQA